MTRLTRNDYAASLDLLERLEGVAHDADAFTRATVAAVDRLLPSELATLSVCDLALGRRRVVATPGVRLGAAEIASFDRHFFAHPLVRHHGVERRSARSRRISDLVDRASFRNSALYSEYYRRIGVDHAVAIPLYTDGRSLVSVVLNRRARDFDDRDMERLELLRPHLAFLYRHACERVAADDPRASLAPALAQPAPAGLTSRECEVLGWLAHGKTDADIGSLLAISRRTVQKHLEHVYVKLGVETRTAAVMRALAIARGRQAARGPAVPAPGPRDVRK